MNSDYARDGVPRSYRLCTEVKALVAVRLLNADSESDVRPYASSLNLGTILVLRAFMNRFLFRGLQILLVLGCASYWPGAAIAQISSTFQPSGPADWFEPSNWSDGIPNGPGDVATFSGGTTGDQNANLTSAVTLGQFVAQFGRTVQLDGTGPLTFDNSPSGLALFHVVRPTTVINVPIAIAAGQQLEVLTDLRPVTINGQIMAGNSPIHKTGSGSLVLAGNSSAWDGVLTVSDGTITVNHSSALGSSLGHTVIQGATVVVNQPISEPMVLSSGLIQSTVHFIDFAGLVTLPAGNTGTIRGPFELQGGTAGQGDLRIVATSNAATTVAVAPLNHQGGVIISSGEATPQFATFRVDNGYLGATTVTDVSLETRTPAGLGSPASGTTVTRGSLRLHGASQERVTLFDSTLALWSAEETLDELQMSGEITLVNSELTTYGQFRGAKNYIVQQPIQVGAGANRIATGLGALTLAGGIAGSGNLLLDPDDDPINIGGPISELINPEVRGGPVRFLHENAYGGEIFVRNGGRLLIESDQEMDRIRFGTLVRTGCCGPGGSIEVAEGASLVADHVDMVQGLIRGNVTSRNGLQFSGFVGGRTISHLDSGPTVRVLAGELTLDDTTAGRQPTNASIVVERPREAAVFVTQRSITDADVHLNNGSGFNFGGALLTENDTSAQPELTLRGDIYLGAQGAHIGGSDHFRLEGQIYGGDLNLGRRRGNPGLVIVAGPAAYTGVSRIFSGELVVAENGRLSATSAVELYPDGKLYADNLAADGPLSDRIADDVPIRMYGGELSVWPTEWGMNSRERVGRIEFERGVSIVRGTHYSSNSLRAHADLAVGEISRKPGAILSISTGDRRSSSPFPREQTFPSTTDIILEDRPALVNGILPAWITYGVNFTTYDAEGRIRDYQGPFTSFAAADETSIVRPPSSPSSLTEDKTIHALYAFGNVGPVDLGGHTLTIGSGGISGATLSNGTIRPGQHANGELIFFGGNTVDADIVDNGAPTSVVYVGDVVVGGNNSYTGKTFVVGRPGEDVRVTNAAALPTGTDIDISGYTDLVLRDLSGNVAYQFGDVSIRDGGTLLAQCCGNGDTVSASSILLEAGTLSVPLVGESTIVKRTEGIATMRRSSPGFSGRVDVLEGVLQAGDSGSDGYLTFGQGTVNVEPGGRLVLSPVGTPADPNAPVPNVKLNGGSLFGTSTLSDSRANLRGTLEVTQNSAIYLLDGLADRPRTADFTVDGDIHVHAGKALEVIGRPDTARGLRVTGAIQLENGSVLAGDGAIRAHVQIAAGAVLSPGLLEGPGSVGLLATSTPIFTSELDESRMTWGEGGRYRWEINDANGDEGAPFLRGWDVTRIGVFLNIEATPSSPFIIEPVGVNADGEIGVVEGLTPHQHYRWLIAEIGTINAFSATIDGFAADKFAIDVSTFRQVYPQVSASDFWLDRDSRGIFLNALFVPEPASAIAALWLAILSLVLKRSRW